MMCFAPIAYICLSFLFSPFFLSHLVFSLNIDPLNCMADWHNFLSALCLWVSFFSFYRISLKTQTRIYICVCVSVCLSVCGHQCILIDDSPFFETSKYSVMGFTALLFYYNGDYFLYVYCFFSVLIFYLYFY